MEEIYKKGGARGLLAILALPGTYKQMGRKNFKPRVTKNVKVLTKVFNFFDEPH